jgi:hypothetical protein
MDAVNYSETLIIFTSLRDVSADKLVIFVVFIAACVVLRTKIVMTHLPCHTSLPGGPYSPLGAEYDAWVIN